MLSARFSHSPAWLRAACNRFMPLSTWVRARPTAWARWLLVRLVSAMAVIASSITLNKLVVVLGTT